MIIRLDKGQDWQDVVGVIQAESNSLVNYSAYGEQDNYVDVGAYLSVNEAKSLAFDSRVIWIEHAGEAALSDERACNITAGLYLNNSASTPAGSICSAPMWQSRCVTSTPQASAC